jgi:hypothetical protein
MKTALSSVLLLLLVVAANAQVPFPLTDATWVNTEYTYTFNPPNPIPDEELTDVDYYCVSGEDTVIQSQTYTKVRYCGDAYKGALRDDSGIVYFVPADSTDEYLLYDFTAQQGQSLNNVLVGNHFDETVYLADLTVNQVTTEVIAGLTRRVVYADSYRWIEGIGCVTGLFMEPWANVSMYDLRLECMSVNGETIFPIEANGDCALTVGIAEVPDRSTVSVYPNPSNGLMTITCSGGQMIEKLVLLDVLGREITGLAVNASTVNWEPSVPNGTYLISVTLQGGATNVHRIVRQ